MDNNLYLQLVKAGFTRPSYLINDVPTFEQIWKELPDSITTNIKYVKILLNSKNIAYFAFGHNIFLEVNGKTLTICNDDTDISKSLAQLAAEMYILLKENNLIQNENSNQIKQS